MNPRIAIALVATLALAPASAEDNGPTLKRIMQDLGVATTRAAAAISKENWSGVADAAGEVAGHKPIPEAEEKRIHDLLGADFEKFEALDEATHKAANALAESAKRGDGSAVIDEFGKLQHLCLACHQAYRKRIHP